MVGIVALALCAGFAVSAARTHFACGRLVRSERVAASLRAVPFALILFAFAPEALAGPPENPCGTSADNCTKGVAAAAADALYKYYLSNNPNLGPYVVDIPAEPGREFGSFCVRWTTPAGCYGSFFYRQRTFPPKPVNPCGGPATRNNCSRARAHAIAEDILYYYQTVMPERGAFLMEGSDSDFIVRWTSPPGSYGTVYYVVPKPTPYEPVKNLGSTSCGAPSSDRGNPINVAIGNKHQEEVDIDSPGGLRFSRYYNSDSAMRTDSVGLNWTHSYSRRVILGADGLSVSVTRPDGRVEQFSKVPGGWQKSASSSGVLSAVSDTSGSVTGWTYAAAPTETEAYDSLGRLIMLIRPDSGNLSLEYNFGLIEGGLGDYLLTSVRNRQGRALSFSYSPDRKLQQITDDTGVRMSYGYDAQGRLVSATEADGSSRTYVYSEPEHTGGSTTAWLLTGILDTDGTRFATYKYDATGKGVATMHASGVDAVQIGYPASSVAQVVKPNGSSESREFITIDGMRRMSRLTESCSACGPDQITSYEYDVNGRLSASTTPSGSVTQYSYTDNGRLRRWIQGVGTEQSRTYQYDWDEAGRNTSSEIFDASGKLVVQQALTRNDAGQITSDVTMADGISRGSSYTYCAAQDIALGICPSEGLIIRSARSTGAGLTTTSYFYYMDNDPGCASSPLQCKHRIGDLWKVTDALGYSRETLTYDGAGRPQSIRDANGVVTDYEYHPRGWMTAVKVRGENDSAEVDDRITRIEYWPTGLVKKVTQPDGVLTSYTYDAAHRLTDVADNAGNTIHYILDNAGNRVAEETKDASGTLKRTLSRVYNQLGQMSTQADALANPTDFDYDASGNVVSITDALGRTTQQEYDPLNRLKRTLQDVGGIGAETKFGYDALDNVTEVTDPKGLKTSYSYNGLGDLLQQVSPDTGTTTFTYDAAGNRASQTDARNKTTTYTHDALNRLTGIGYADTGLNVTYTYDVIQDVCTDGETFAVGHLTRMHDGSGLTQYCYNRFGDLTRKVQTVDGVSLTLRYAYSPGGRLVALTYPDGSVVDYPRDGQGRVSAIGVTPPAGARQLLLSGASYHPFGPVAGWTYGNGRLLSRNLDMDYRTASIHDDRPGGLSVGFTYDEVGSLTGLTQAGSTLPEVAFGYDALGRLTQFKDGPTGVVIDAYGYDKTGNRTSLTTAAGTSAYTYPADSHRLASVDGVPRTYDAAGNTLSIEGGARQFTYDDTGRMSGVQAAGVTTRSYAYNSKGERVRSYLGPDNTYTLYDEAGHWIGDYDTNGVPIQQAIWMDDLPVGLRTAAAGTLSYIEPDHLGSPRVVIDPVADRAIWKWDLKGEAFGATDPEQDLDGDGISFKLDMRFPGQRYDAASRLNQNGFRDYEAATGRYLQSDPTGLSGGISTYGYAFGNPLLFIDPLGLAPNQACAAGWIATCTVVGGGIGYWGGGIIVGAAGSEVPVAGNAAGFVAGSQLGGMGGASAGGVLGGLTASLVCPEEKPCPPCRTIDGLTVPVGTIGYRLDIVPPGKPHHPYKGSHYNLYKANQNPNNCQCFWQEVGASDAAGGLPPPPGSIAIRPFAN